MPERLLEGLRDEPDPARLAWVKGLPRTVAAVAERWGLRLEPPYQPGGLVSWAAPAIDPTGRERVLKVTWRHDESRHEAEGLQAMAGHGAVLPAGIHIDEGSGTSAMLLERCRPGATLAAALPGPDQDAVIADALRRIWTTPHTGGPFRPLSRMCDDWAAGFEAVSAERPALLDPGLARAGIELFRELPRTADRTVLLCTDLHAENVLSAEREPWLVIDPKPYVGDPTYDALQHMLNHGDRLVADPHAFATRMAGLLGLDAERLTRWLFARCVQESPSHPDLRGVARRLAP